MHKIKLPRHATRRSMPPIYCLCCYTIEGKMQKSSALPTLLISRGTVSIYIYGMLMPRRSIHYVVASSADAMSSSAARLIN